MWSSSIARVILVTMLLLPLAQPGLLVAQASQDDANIQLFHTRIPLGVSGFFVRPARRDVFVMGTAISPSFEGWRVVEHGHDHIVLAGDGSLVRVFPRQVQFRITATANLEQPLIVERDMLDIKTDLNQFLLGLGFRLKIFHALQATEVAPDSVAMIGMPADVPYDERVYRLSFTLPEVPIHDRVVLEVLTPGGDRLCKLHLEF